MRRILELRSRELNSESKTPRRVCTDRTISHSSPPGRSSSGWRGRSRRHPYAPHALQDSTTVKLSTRPVGTCTPETQRRPRHRTLHCEVDVSSHPPSLHLSITSLFRVLTFLPTRSLSRPRVPFALGNLPSPSPMTSVFLRGAQVQLLVSPPTPATNSPVTGPGSSVSRSSLP